MTNIVLRNERVTQIKTISPGGTTTNLDLDNLWDNVNGTWDNVNGTWDALEANLSAFPSNIALKTTSANLSLKGVR